MSSSGSREQGFTAWFLGRPRRVQPGRDESGARRRVPEQRGSGAVPAHREGDRTETGRRFVHLDGLTLPRIGERRHHGHGRCRITPGRPLVRQHPSDREEQRGAGLRARQRLDLVPASRTSRSRARPAPSPTGQPIPCRDRFRIEYRRDSYSTWSVLIRCSNGEELLRLKSRTDVEKMLELLDEAHKQGQEEK